MSVFSGPNVSDSGLVFAYDMYNPAKSWKGAPTTNLNSAQSLNGMSGISLSLVGVENGWKKYSINGTWASGTYPFSMNISNTTLSGTVAYSAQVIIKTNVRSKFLTFGGLNYVNDVNMVNGGVSTVTSLGNDTDGLEMILSKREGFIYSAGFANPTTTQLGYINSRPTADGVSFSSTTDFVWVKNIQVEQGTFCTPWVESARSNTQALLDLTGKNSIVLDSLAYNSSNIFQFDGINNYATFGNNSAISSIGGTANITVEAWVKYDSYVGNNGAQSYSVVTHKGTPWTWLMENPTNKGRIRFTIGGADVNCADPDTHPLNEWMQWVGTYDGSNMRFYRNGVLKNTVAASGTLGSNSVAATVGQYAGQYRMDGQIPVVKIYNRALSAVEVQQNFAALRSRFGI